MFKIAVVGGFAEKYIDRCLSSIILQDRSDWECRVVLDPVGDRSFDVAQDYRRPNLAIKLNENRQYQVKNFFDAFALMNPEDDDILVQVDADDWLAGVEVLSIVKKYYDAVPSTLLTHGSWISYPNPNIVTNNRAYTAQDFAGGIRKAAFRASHLRTMRWHLWKKINDVDLRDEKGEYVAVAGDMAMMFPALEMAGFERVRYIPEILYVYNQETPFNDGKQHREEQARLDGWFRSKKPYARLVDL